jgi:hypothetical protein
VRLELWLGKPVRVAEDSEEALEDPEGLVVVVEAVAEDSVEEEAKAVPEREATGVLDK